MRLPMRRTPRTSFPKASDTGGTAVTNGAFLTAVNLTTAPTTTATSADAGEGTYRIRGDRLWLTRGGATRALPFYLRACGSDPQVMLVIDGALYLRDD